MFHTVIIGQGKLGNMATKVFGLESQNISDGGNAWWISEVFPGNDLTVHKYTDCGKEISRLIQTGADKDTFDQLFKHHFILWADVKLTLRIIQQVSDRRFAEGQESKVAEFKKVLDIRDGR